MIAVDWACMWAKFRQIYFFDENRQKVKAYPFVFLQILTILDIFSERAETLYRDRMEKMNRLELDIDRKKSRFGAFPDA